MATNSAGADKDWLEVYNPDTNIVTLSGLIFVDELNNLAIPAESRTYTGALLHCSARIRAILRHEK